MTVSPLAAKAVPLHVITLRNFSILDQLHLEEALLRADERNWCVINYGSPPAIVMGISGKPELLINDVHLQTKPVPVIRRFSGGGTVFIDKHTFFMTWICRKEDSGVKCCPQTIHQWAESFYCKALSATDMKLNENDYVIGERKFGGNAQYLCKDRWLHHSSLLWDYEASNMEYLQIPTKMPSYRQKRSHLDFLCKLKPYYADLASLEQSIKRALNKEFQVVEVHEDGLADILKRPHRRATEVL